MIYSLCIGGWKGRSTKQLFKLKSATTKVFTGRSIGRTFVKSLKINSQYDNFLKSSNNNINTSNIYLYNKLI